MVQAPQTDEVQPSKFQGQEECFKTLVLSRSGLSNWNLCPQASEEAELFITHSKYSFTKPTLTFYAGEDSKGPVKAVAHMRNPAGHYTVGLGDPHVETGPGKVRWENFNRLSTFSEKHTFCCEVEGVRRWFLWRHPGKLLEKAGDLDLVECDEDGVVKENDMQGEEIVLVKYERTRSMLGKIDGTYRIRKGLGEDWALMALVTGVGLVMVRRAAKGH